MCSSAGASIRKPDKEDATAALKRTTTPQKKREAIEQLEDYGLYAVPPLTRLLNDDALSDADRFEVLRWLIRSSYRPTIRSGSRRLSGAERDENRERVKENRLLGTYKWTLGDPRGWRGRWRRARIRCAS